VAAPAAAVKICDRPHAARPVFPTRSRRGAASPAAGVARGVGLIHAPVAYPCTCAPLR